MKTNERTQMSACYRLTRGVRVLNAHSSRQWAGYRRLVGEQIVYFPAFDTFADSCRAFAWSQQCRLHAAKRKLQILLHGVVFVLTRRLKQSWAGHCTGKKTDTLHSLG